MIAKGVLVRWDARKGGAEALRAPTCARWVAVCGLLLVLAGCSWFPWAKEGPSAKKTAEQETAGAPARAEDYEAALKETVRGVLASAPSEPDNGHGKFVRRKPYFYKEYDTYPRGFESAKTVITKTESRTAPYVANVKIDKLRFATRLHRKRDEGRGDENYLRETGTETQTYEYRNGRWKLRGTFFLVEKTEENVNGEWVPLESKVANALSPREDESRSWFGRMWSRITGRD